jgi:hypothetical protein
MSKAAASCNAATYDLIVKFAAITASLIFALLQHWSHLCIKNEIYKFKKFDTQLYRCFQSDCRALLP